MSKKLTSSSKIKKPSNRRTISSPKIAKKSQVKILIAKGLKQFKRTIKALEDK